MSLSSLLGEVVRRQRTTTALLKTFVRSHRNRFQIPKTERLPPQPWRVANHWPIVEVARLDAFPGHPAVVPTAYSASGPLTLKWPFRDGVEGFDVPVNRSANVTVLPRRIVIGQGAGILPFCVPNQALQRLPLNGGYVLKDELAGGPELRLQSPVFIADCCWSGVYGHLLLEILPTLLLRELLPVDTIVLTSAPLTRTLFRTFAQLGVPRDRIHRITGPINCAEVYWSDPVSRLRRGSHPAIWSAYRRLADLGTSSVVERPRRVFVSRAGIRGRRLEEETKVEELFVRRGFAIVRPETMPIEDQIAIWSSAEMIAGLGGSGMHNAVFARPETPVLIIQTRSMSVETDVSLTPPSRRLGYVFGKTEAFSHQFWAPWTVDLRDVEAGIDGHFGV